MFISSGLIPVAEEYARSPPVTIVSYALGSGINDPSEVFLRITITSPLCVVTTSSSNLITVDSTDVPSSVKINPVCPAPVILDIIASGFDGLVSKLGSSILIPFLYTL